MSRRYFPESRIEVAAWAEAEAFSCDDAEVWIEDGSILVSYFDDDGIVVLEGVTDRAEGWILAARSRPRRATLARIDARTFAGSIEESGESASWSLRLGSAR